MCKNAFLIRVLRASADGCPGRASSHTPASFAGPPPHTALRSGSTCRPPTTSTTASDAASPAATTLRRFTAGSLANASSSSFIDANRSFTVGRRPRSRILRIHGGTFDSPGGSRTFP